MESRIYVIINVLAMIISRDYDNLKRLAGKSLASFLLIFRHREVTRKAKSLRKKSGALFIANLWR